MQELRHTRPDVLGDDGLLVGSIVTTDQGQAVVRRTQSASPSVLVPPWGRDPYDARYTCATLHDESDVQELLAWRDLRQKLTNAVIDHECVCVHRDEEWGELQDVVILRDHLEKDQIRWWSASELRQVIRERGTLGSDRFRPYFMPVLQTVLTEIDAEMPAPDAPSATASPPPPGPES